MGAEPETPDPDTLILRKALEPYFTKNACRETIDKIIIFHARKIANKAWNNGHEIALNAMPITAQADEITRLRAALKPFADCCEYISDDEDNDEWAKFRLIIKNYRDARAALKAAQEVKAIESGEHLKEGR